MARDDDDLTRAQRTRTGRVWVMLVPALIFLLLLVIFIAQNGQKVQVKFFGGEGEIALAVALLASALAGAAIVLLIGSLRIVQLRLAARRHQRQDLAAVRGAQSTGGDPQAVQPQGDADRTRP